MAKKNDNVTRFVVKYKDADGIIQQYQGVYSHSATASKETIKAFELECSQTLRGINPQDVTVEVTPGEMTPEEKRKYALGVSGITVRPAQETST